MTLALLAATALTGAASSLVLIRLLRPLLLRYALARPNARSSHTVPTPQGGGIAVLAAALIAVTAAALLVDGLDLVLTMALPAAAAVVLAVTGAVDDIRPLPALPRLAIQVAAVALVVGAGGMPRLLPDAVPLPIERTLLVFAGVWWVNLVNFMDGIDWITVANFVPLTAVIGLMGLAGLLPPAPTMMAAALLGGLLGFAPANRPVASLFLGDVGSLPIGLLTGWMLLWLAAGGALPAALLLPLYYLADATLTLALRLRRGERVWEAHRSHYYQRARDNGYSVMAVDARVLALNLALAALAAITIRWPHPAVVTPCLAAGGGLVAATLRGFATRRRPAATG